MTADQEAFANMREWIDSTPARQAAEEAHAAQQRATLGARGETLADAVRRWEDARQERSARVASRTASRRDEHENNRRQARRVRPRGTIHTEPEQGVMLR